jgi:predicted transcriptional regulator
METRIDMGMPFPLQCSKQKYRLTVKGKKLLKRLSQKDSKK